MLPTVEKEHLSSDISWHEIKVNCHTPHVSSCEKIFILWYFIHQFPREFDMISNRKLNLIDVAAQSWFSPISNLSHIYLKADCCFASIFGVVATFTPVNLPSSTSLARLPDETSWLALATQLITRIVTNKWKITVNLLEYIIGCCLRRLLLSL